MTTGISTYAGRFLCEGKMNKLSFMLQNVRCAIQHSKFTCFILVFALTVSLIFPVIAMNEINDLIADRTISRYADAAHTIIIDYFMQVKSPEELDGVLLKGESEGLFESSAYNINRNIQMDILDESFEKGISGISKDFLKLTPHQLVAGQLFSEEDFDEQGENVCLLTHRSTFAKGGLAVGDTIVISGETYWVKGIIRCNKLYGGVILPYASSAALFSDTISTLQYQFVLTGDIMFNVYGLADKLFPGESVINAQTGSQQEKTYFDSVRVVNRNRMWRALLVVSLAIINICMLVAGMLIRERKSLAIHLACGADWRMLRVEIILKNTTIFLVSYFIAIVFYALFARFVIGAIRSLMVNTVIQILLGGVLLIYMMTYFISQISFKKPEVIDLLRK
jgi:hypothetical protein